MTKIKSEALKNRLAFAFAAVHDTGDGDFEEHQREFVFHMMDWAEDCVRLAELYRDPSAISDTEAEATVSAFIYHAPGHLRAAAKLYGVLLEPFEDG